MKRPEIGSIAGYLMDVLFNDYLHADVEQALRINKTISLIPEDQREQSNLEHIDIHIISPSIDVRELTENYANSLPWTVRSLMKRIGAWGGDWRVPSYLLFEPDFINALMDIGYKDAMSHRDELQEFFKED